MSLRGRKTIDSIKEYAKSDLILPDRFVTSITSTPRGTEQLTTKKDKLYSLTSRSFDVSLQYAKVLSNSGVEVFVIGGSSIYEQFMPFIDRIYLTEVDLHIVGEPETSLSYFNFDEYDFRLSEKSPSFEEEGITYRFITYDRFTS